MNMKMARYRGVQLPRHWCALCMFVAIFLVQCQMSSANDVAVRPPGRVKRGSVFNPVIEFLEAVKKRPIDLIILMERSWHVGRQRFYLRARKLVSYVLRYYVKMGPFDVKLVVATFATDFTVHIHGMRDSILKCQIWDEFWDKVVLDDRPAAWNTAHVRRAYEQARDIFNTYGSASREKYIWLLTSGAYDMANYDPIPIASALKNMGVKIVATKVGGNEGQNANIRRIITSDQYHGGEVQDWITTLENVVEITDGPDLMLSSASALCYCEQSFGFTICGGCLSEPCGHGIDITCSHDCICNRFTPSILCPKLNTRKVCPIYSGKTGRYCDVDVVECLPGTCANNGTCHEDIDSSYSCKCPAPYSPKLLCEREHGTDGHTVIPPNATSGSSSSSIGPAVGGALGGLALIIILVIGFCIWRKKRRRPETRDAAINTERNKPSTISTLRSLNVFDLFRRKEGLHTPSGTGTYLEVESLPPALPPSLPPPTVHYLKSKSRKSLSGLLKFIPEHLHPSTHQVEIEKPVSVINEYHRGAAVGDDGDDEGDYENVGSKNMPEWESYVMKLATVGGLRNFAIVKYDREAYVTTCEIWLLPSKEELSNIYNVLLSRRNGGNIELRSACYKVTKNNGKMLESWLEGRTPDVLCVGRSKQYLVLGVETDRNNTGNCYQEVSWVRENLSGQGK